MPQSNIERILAHYSKIARTRFGLESHYAAGVVDMAKQIKKIRDGFKTELAELWRTRQGSPPSAKGTMSVLRMVIRSLDSIEEPQTP